MNGLFQSILQMSITGSFVILFVYLVRLLLKRAPKIYSYVLWAVVLFRLLCPVTLTSSVSLVPEEIASPQMQVHEIVEESELPGSEEHQEMVPSLMPEESKLPEVAMEEKKIVSPEVKLTLALAMSGWDVAAIGWMLGVILMACYSVFSLKRIYRTVQIAVLHEGNVYIAQDIHTPFTLGVFSPKIYLPTGLAEKEMVYIIAHEKHHIKRCDHLIKMIAFFTLSIHWFNPLVWFAFVQAGKDMEMSCDEAVMKAFPEDIRREYSGSLLNLATGRKIVAMAPLAFGEGSVKGRIKNVMNYKKPVFWISVMAVAVCIALAVGLLTNPKEENESPENLASTESIEESENVTLPESSGTPETTGAPTESPREEEWEFVEKEINVLYGDLTGDGIDERIVLGIDVLPESVQENDFEKLLHSAYLAKVSVYKGLGGGSYEEDAIWNFDDISTSRPGNYQLSLIEKDGKDYLLISSIQEQQGYAGYYYKVISLAESGEEILQDEYEVSFKFAETSEAAEWQQEEELPIRSDVVPDFQEHLSKWYDEKGTLIIATDLNMWGEDVEGVLYSKPDFWVWYMKYYEKVFERQDYYTLAEKTMFRTKYFTFELPQEWADKVHYEETEDGKVVWLYHTKTSELEWGMGLLGTIFLEEEELAMETMDMVPARYIGEPYVAEDGKTYMPMSCQPTDVQCVEETAREYNEMSAYFADGRMAKHVWVTENGTYNNPLWELAFYQELYPEYGLASRRAACFGQKLPWEGYPEDYILFDSDGENHTLIINDKDYSAMLKDSLYLENIDNAWYAVVDAYEVDNSREIIIFDDGPSGDPHLHVLQVTDGELSVVGELGTLSFMSSFVFSGKQSITILERTWLPENNVVTKSYIIEDKKLVEIPRGEYEFVYKDFHKLLKDLEVYKEQDLSSEMVTLKAEEDWIRFNKVFSSAEEGERLYEIETMDREIYYLYSDGWLDDYVADLSHAG